MSDLAGSRRASSPAPAHRRHLRALARRRCGRGVLDLSGSASEVTGRDPPVRADLTSAGRAGRGAEADTVPVVDISCRGA